MEPVGFACRTLQFCRNHCIFIISLERAYSVWAGGTLVSRVGAHFLAPMSSSRPFGICHNLNMEFPDSPNLLELPSDTSDNEEESAVDAEVCSPPLQPVGQMWFDIDAGASPPPPEDDILEETEESNLTEAQKEELFDSFHPGVAGSLQEACEMIDFPTQVDSPDNVYISSLAKSRDLHIRMPLRVMNAYQKHGILGFFLIFITPSRLEAMRVWTNEVLKFKKRNKWTKSCFTHTLG